MTSYGILLVILTLLLGGSIAVASTQYSKRQLHNGISLKKFCLKDNMLHLIC